MAIEMCETKTEDDRSNYKIFFSKIIGSRHQTGFLFMLGAVDFNQKGLKRVNNKRYYVTLSRFFYISAQSEMVHLALVVSLIKS